MNIVSQARNAIGRAKGYGECYRCGGTWDYTNEHQTPYKDGYACFPLCQVCWAGLTTNERLPYYRALLDKWISLDPGEADEYEREWERIKTAVESGL